MFRILSKFFIGLGLIGLSSVAIATDLQQVTETLETPMLIVTKLLVFACYVVGAILILGAVAQYKNHRESPKLVPLTTPLLLLFLGIVLLLVPYFTTLGKSESAIEQQKREGKDVPPPSLFTKPTEESQLGPGSLPDDEPEEPYYEDDYQDYNSGGSNGGSSGGGHWSDDPRYR